MKTWFLIVAILICGCETTANSSWWLEWQILPFLNNYDKAKCQLILSYNGDNWEFNGIIVDSGYVYASFIVKGSVEIVNSSTRPNVEFQFINKDSILVDTVLNWEDMNFQCQASRQYSTKYCQLSKKTIIVTK